MRHSDACGVRLPEPSLHFRCCHVQVSGTVFLVKHNPVFSKTRLVGLVFDGVVALVGAAQCLLFMQFQAHAQALPLADADSAV
jgi:hypothetical protein